MWVGVLPLCRDVVGVFYSLSRLGNLFLLLWLLSMMMIGWGGGKESSVNVKD